MCKEVWDIIKKLPLGKALGCDGITNSAISHLLKICIIFLVKTFTSRIRFSCFPYVWENTAIIMIPKSMNSHQYPENHMPISLFITLSKVFEKTILNKLKLYT